MNLNEVKNKISKDFLGRWGIHGVGTSAYAINVHSTTALTSAQKRTIMTAAQPFGLKFIVEDAPRLLKL